MSITVDDVKTHAIISSSDDDDLITNFIIPAAIGMAENYTGLTILQIGSASPPVYATQIFDEWGDYIELTAVPIIEVISITYVDLNGDTQTWNSDNWELDTRNQRAIIYPAYGQDFPTTRNQKKAIMVEYDAGYESMPAALKIGILQICATLYEQREDLIAMPSIKPDHDLPWSSKLIMDPYRVIDV